MNSIPVYVYDEHTREFIYEDMAYADPMNPEEYLLPAHATLAQVPGRNSGYAHVWIGDKWASVEDHRKVVDNDTGVTLREATQFWLVEDTYFSPGREINVLGPLPTGASLIRPAPTMEYLAEMLRSARDSRLTSTDYLLMPDYKSPNGRSISEDAMASVENYRQELRNITNKPGFPWDGGGENTPWPVKPAGVK